MSAVNQSWAELANNYPQLINRLRTFTGLILRKEIDSWFIDRKGQLVLHASTGGYVYPYTVISRYPNMLDRFLLQYDIDLNIESYLQKMYFVGEKYFAV